MCHTQFTIDAAVDPLRAMTEIGDLPMQDDFRATGMCLSQGSANGGAP